MPGAMSSAFGAGSARVACRPIAWSKMLKSNFSTPGIREINILLIIVLTQSK
jgi:hypothetical protein